ncbi:MAG: UTP--glucose-1-phosphate uridylyltransferase [Chlamydiota bacterium]
MICQSLQEQARYLDELIGRLSEAESLEDKIAVLDGEPQVGEVPQLSLEEEWIYKAMMAIGQDKVVFRGIAEVSNDKLSALLKQLKAIDEAYQAIGGVIGYHAKVLELLAQQEGKVTEEEVNYYPPEGVDLSEDSKKVRRALIGGLEFLPMMGELYPIGGAGDRLGLVDEKSGEPLPAAKLNFMGNTLLTNMIRDLQAREYLYYKLHGKQVTTPIAMMTSEEKNNHHHIVSICRANGWFGRGEDNFKFFTQLSVPVITKDGNWSMKDILEPTLKPGGHGVIWRLAKDNGIFDWLEKQQRCKLLVRQVNNPMAGIDHGMISFVGVGRQKTFGIASCDRLVGSPEGMLVMKERRQGHKYSYGITNIEYTDFVKKGIEDKPVAAKSSYSKFPSNTNILFVDIEKVRKAVDSNPLPGMLINLKKKAPYCSPDGTLEQVPAGRLETTMQNIADEFSETHDHQLEEKEWQTLPTFLTYNQRRKTMSVTKTSYQGGNSFNDTPPGCFYDYQQNIHELLTLHCAMELPGLPNVEDYYSDRPAFIGAYHPALGPAYDVVAQKVRRGRLAPGAELQLEIAELFLNNLDLDGSLLIKADNLTGFGGFEAPEKLAGKCLLNNVKVFNAGIDHSADNVYWQNNISRKESMKIILHGNAEFIAENITFKGDEHIEVASGFKMTASQVGDKVHYSLEPIGEPSWYWKYSVDDDYRIVLSR